MKAWDKQKKLQTIKIPKVEEIITLAKSMNIKEASLFILTYLTAGRVSEIVRYKGQGLTPESLQFTTQHDRPILLITLPNRKNKDRPYKDIPIPLDRPENQEMADVLKLYLKLKREREFLFPFSTTRAWQILDKHGFNPHFLRHIRLTHLVTKYNFNDQMLVKYAGWTDSQPAKYYMELKWHDLLDNL